MLDLNAEIAEIGRLITSAAFFDAVRKEVDSIKKGSFVVTDGRHQEGGEGYEVVVKCSGSTTSVARRISENVPGVRVEKIADHVLGITHSRRGNANG